MVKRKSRVIYLACIPWYKNIMTKYPCKYLNECCKGGIVDTSKDTYSMTKTAKGALYWHYACSVGRSKTLVPLTDLQKSKLNKLICKIDNWEEDESLAELVSVLRKIK